MKFARDPLNAVTIRRVERGAILIGEETYASTVGVTAERVVEAGLPSGIDELSAESLAPLSGHIRPAIGTQPWVVLLARFADSPGPNPPEPKSWC